MSAVAAVPLRLLNHVFLSLFVCCGARVFVYPRSTYRVVQSLLCEGRSAQLSTPVLSARILSHDHSSLLLVSLFGGGVYPARDMMLPSGVRRDLLRTASRRSSQKAPSPSFGE